MYGLIEQDLAMSPNRFAVTVHDGQVIIDGKTGRRSQIGTLVRAIRHVEGVVSVTAHLGYEVDDLLPEAHVGPLF